MVAPSQIFSSEQTLALLFHVLFSLPQQYVILT
jgi:hypothetical protein